MIAFFLGSHPEVSLAELRLMFGVKESSRLMGVAMFELDTMLVQNSFFKLGGVPRWGEVIAELDKNDNLENHIISAFKKQLKEATKKEYIFSLYGVKLDKKRLHHDLKDELPGSKYDGRFDEALHAPAVSEHVLKRGGQEFSAISSGNTVYIIKTIQVQDAQFWSITDAERPARDMKIGLLPAKLARMMINLSGAQATGKIWDPFVGQATIAMQAAVLGIPVLGTDKSPESIAKAKQNMQWLIRNGLVSQAKHTLYVEAIERSKADRTVTAVVTEPYLGKPRYRPFGNEFLAKREWREISRLYGTLLQVASGILHKGQCLVFIKPTFSFLAEHGGEWYNPPLPMSGEAWKVPEFLVDLGPLLWLQRDSIIGREIVVLEKR
ncbi:hypothetical protein CO112_02500 [Candidatus Dojkabacteria bacterium CG_4_9_14_3_um_filter_150_Dojkabacteria_WS6_41_13]|uniref:Ribosomal RNA large subunit methyltransferase K/L-like methyltransferase domain-containing protein n=1 Tax=Candidatus Dojkabacteria bacterium CG_4_10_14_0_2_um_filter_Dojkabacteria_WS6_41_15 TaxID=2014249 RepID=A0A2M7W0W8_9BACT|nr:MAG: hypothetical protein COZ14_03025 [Candidatus Dojkabacteria bacterium CG_4_10_14_3_um_filter_Dojkabacteria_WS6_41_9]PJA12613.1 MAG: hypothetical protein COX64_04260 [Candidatus Dojkabacteria bacterium CG_4_10_14_0_2_um_filter_Dojkabacteria_WS6_41_15]PJB22797.1 MAG: hypothetical protein CO112_02500 [Candidatus Dojkabacteria bacterium CG_4_9_14_3_um_filter_150_Dojkabacteria_WS6_41_13]